MQKIQIKEFDWHVWDYSFFGDFIYTYEQSPLGIEFYFASPFSFKWGRGESDLLIDGNVFMSLTNDNEGLLIDITPDASKSYSTLSISPTKGPIVIDQATFFKNLFTSNTFDSRPIKIGDKTYLTSSFVLSPKGGE